MERVSGEAWRARAPRQSLKVAGAEPSDRRNRVRYSNHALAVIGFHTVIHLSDLCEVIRTPVVDFCAHTARHAVLAQKFLRMRSVLP